eukprot:1748911-Rhodomonas_salina.2
MPATHLAYWRCTARSTQIWRLTSWPSTSRTAAFQVHLRLWRQSASVYGRIAVIYGVSPISGPRCCLGGKLFTRKANLVIVMLDLVRLAEA